MIFCRSRPAGVIMKVTNSIINVGVNDTKIDLFEGQYVVPNGISYNSYLISDEKVAVTDTVDGRFATEWLENLKNALGGRTPDYLVVTHMEPDHSASILNFKKVYPEAKIVSSDKAFVMMKNYFGTDFADSRVVVKEGEVLDLGMHKLNFVAAPMVHWPEVMVAFDSAEKVLFSADAFGTFAPNDGVTEPDLWAEQARRYYIGIVGKYGMPVQTLLKKAAGLDIKTICPLHGPILTENLGDYIKLYDLWSSYTPEKKGVVVAYTSVYGHTKQAVMQLVEDLKGENCGEIKVFDLARSDMAEAVAAAFCYDKLVLATTTYNGEIFPFMREFINHLTERGFCNRRVALIENGSWAPVAANVMRRMFEKSKNLSFAETQVKILSQMSDANRGELKKLAAELCGD